MPASIVEYRDVYKAFDLPVLEGVSLSVEQGEILALVGPSGTGKSVLLKTTIGLVAPDDGDVRVSGRSVVSASARELLAIREQVGYVFQHAALFDSMSVFDNVAMGLPREQLAKLSARERQERVVRALEEVNLELGRVADKLPAELSGGMRKRVGLARAIVRAPKILLYDEPVTGLDPINAATVDQLIVQIARKAGVTSVVVTHDVEGALSLCDRIGLLAGGKLRFVGTPEAFRAHGDEIVRAFAHREHAALIAKHGAPDDAVRELW